MTLLRTPAGVLLSYTALALALSWPLPAHLATHLTAVPGGDGGVYVWNQWVFHHEMTRGDRLPYFTDRILAASGGGNLGLHNYTPFQNLLALPLIPAIGVVPAFNVIYLLMTVLSAYSAFLLARRITGGVAESWLAGLLFAWSPLLVARGIGHFSLVAAAPLAIFLLLLLRAAQRPRWPEGVGLGLTLWWAASTDVYYAVYCVMIAAFFLGSRVVSLERAPARPAGLRHALDVLILGVLGLIAAVTVTGGGELTLFGRAIRMHGLYTPVLVLTALAVVRLAYHYRPLVAPVTGGDVRRVAWLAALAGVVAAALMAPLLYAAAPLMTGESPAPTILWRSSPAGANLLAFVLPSPLHPLAPDALVRWVDRLPGGFIENVVAVPLTVLLVLLAAWRTGWTPPRWWMAFTILFGLLALGPFVQVGDLNTHVPGPWALLRYLPVVELARAPQRFAVVMMLGVSVLFAAALWRLGRAYPQRRQLVLGATAAVLILELLPAPRALYSADVPGIYRHVAAAPGEARLLELPFGVRDGTLSIGNFTARSQFFQTAHGKPLLGGYLSRIPLHQIDRLRQDEVMEGLLLLSEGRSLPLEQEHAVLANGPAFIARADIGFVVIDRAEAPEPLIDLAVRAFRLRHVETDRHFDLYRPDLAPE